MDEDILAPLVRHLASTPSIQELATIVPTDGVNPVLGPPNIDPFTQDTYLGPSNLWIFRSSKDKGEPFANVEGTGSCSITLAHHGSWARANHGNYAEFPEVTVYYHCDPTRDVGQLGSIGAPKKYDARDKCLMIHKRVRRALHIVHNYSPTGFLDLGKRADGTGGLPAASCVAGMSLQIMEAPNSDSMLIGRATFELVIPG